MEVAGGFEAVAGRAAGDEDGLHGDDLLAGSDHPRYLAQFGLSTIESPYFICYRPDMVDPLSEVIILLRPRAVFTKGISGAGRWGVRYSDFGHPSFCTVIEGDCRLAVDGQDALTLDRRRLRAAADDARLHLVRLRAGPARDRRPPAHAARRKARFATARPTARRACACSAVTSCSIRDDAGLLVSLLPTPVACARGRTAFDPGALSQRGNAASSVRGATWCSAAWSRSCWSRRCG